MQAWVEDRRGTNYFGATTVVTTWAKYSDYFLTDSSLSVASLAKSKFILCSATNAYRQLLSHVHRCKEYH